MALLKDLLGLVDSAKNKVSNFVQDRRAETKRFLNGAPLQLPNGMQSTYNQPVPVFKQPKNIAQGGFNLLAAIPNSVVKPFIGAGVDGLDNLTKNIKGVPVRYDDQRSGLTRLGFQAQAAIDPQAGKSAGTRTSLKEVLGNAAEPISSLVDAYTMGGASVAKQALKEGAKMTAKQVIKKTAIDGAKLGGSQALLTSLANNRTNDKDYTKSVALDTLIGAGAGSALGGVAGVGSAVFNKVASAYGKLGFSKEIANDLAKKHFVNTESVQVKLPKNQLEFWAKINKELGRPLETPVFSDDLKLFINKTNKIPQVELSAGMSIKKINRDKSITPDTFDPKAFVKEQVDAQEAAKKSAELGVKEKVMSKISQIKKSWVDGTAPLADAIDQAEKKFKFKVLPKDDFRLQTDKVIKADSIGSQFAKDNGLFSVIKEVDDVDGLNQYLIAKHGLDLSANGKETGRDLTKDAQFIEATKEQFEPFAQKITEYSRKLLDYSVEKGLISKELASDLKVRYPNYVPFNRIFSDDEVTGNQGVTKALASLSKQSVVQKLEGSTREVANPLESLLDKTLKVFRQGEVNDAARMIGSYSKLPGLSGLIREVSDPASAKHKISFLDNGVKRTFEVTPEIEAVAKSFDREQVNTLIKILNVPTRLLQAGATGLNAPFAVTNLLKDQANAFINTKYRNTASPIAFLKAVASVIKKDDIYDQAIRDAALTTSFDIARDGVMKPTIESIRSNKGISSKAGYLVRNPKELFTAVENLIGKTEELTRVQQYRGALAQLVREGRTIEDARLLAAQAARDNTANFGRKGDMSRLINMVVPFFNAGIQGARSLNRAIMQRPAETLAKFTITLGLPTLGVTAWNMSDGRRAEIYADIPEFEKKNNLIIVPDNADKNEKGGWNVIKIPIPPGVSGWSNIIRRAIESSHGGDPQQVSELFGSLIETATSIPTNDGIRGLANRAAPQLGKIIAEPLFNQNTFTGQEIVPGEMKNLPPEQQVKKYTSGTARLIGKAADKSPLIIENMVKTAGAGVGGNILNLSDTLLNKAGVIPDEQVSGENPLQNLKRRFSSASGGETYRRAVADATKGLTQKETAGLDYVNAKDNPLVTTADSDINKMGEAMTLLANPALLNAKVSVERARARSNGTPLDPKWDLPADRLKIALAYDALPEGQDKKNLTKANIDWLEPYWDNRSKYFKDLGIDFPSNDNLIGPQKPQLNPALSRKMDLKMWNDPEVKAYLEANNAWKNFANQQIGLASSLGGGFGGYAQKPKLNKTTLASILKKNPKVSGKKSRLSNISFSKPRNTKIKYKTVKPASFNVKLSNRKSKVPNVKGIVAKNLVASPKKITSVTLASLLKNNASPAKGRLGRA